MMDKGTPSAIEPPADWNDHELTRFFLATQNNRFATFANLKPIAAKLVSLDDAFWHLVKNLKHSPNWFTANLALRALSSWRAGCGLAAAGHTTETYPLLRLTLEFGAVALKLQKKPSLIELYMTRGDSDDKRRRARKAFHQDRLNEEIAASNAALFSRYKRLVAISIDFGAHANEKALTSNIIELKNDEAVSALLCGSGLIHDHALINTARTAMVTLELFQLVFPERFLLLGLAQQMDELRNGL